MLLVCFLLLVGNYVIANESDSQDAEMSKNRKTEQFKGHFKTVLVVYLIVSEVQNTLLAALILFHSLFISKNITQIITFFFYSSIRHFVTIFVFYAKHSIFITAK